jgi:formylglycine-generating enzyme required for sulfatase activity
MVGGILVKTLAADYAVKPALRAAAGDALSQLGDPRPGVGLRADGLPDIAWREAPAGPFLMGSDPAKDRNATNDEQPQHEVTLPAYAISRYPVTNAQYEAFVADGGYTGEWRHCWTNTGWNNKGDQFKPRKAGGVFDLPNHPVVMVSWYEAVAFCNWLTEILRLDENSSSSAVHRIASNQIIRLPSEREWEKAARGTDGRTYPWGEEITPQHANYNQTGIGATSAAGCFPAGQSLYGCEEMAGNVWEWCQTKWQDSYEDYKDDNDNEGNARRVLRGGAFRDSEDGVRCAVRGHYDPFDGYGGGGFRLVLSPFTSGL